MTHRKREASVAAEEAASLEMYHDQQAYTLWYMAHTDDRLSIQTENGSCWYLAPDPTGRWRVTVVGPDLAPRFAFWVEGSWEQVSEAVERMVAYSDTFAYAFWGQEPGHKVGYLLNGRSVDLERVRHYGGALDALGPDGDPKEVRRIFLGFVGFA